MNHETFTCYGADEDNPPNTHEPAEMDRVENSVGDTQHKCPICGVVVE